MVETNETAPTLRETVEKLLNGELDTVLDPDVHAEVIRLLREALARD